VFRLLTRPDHTTFAIDSHLSSVAIGNPWVLINGEVAVDLCDITSKLTKDIPKLLLDVTSRGWGNIDVVSRD